MSKPAPISAAEPGLWQERLAILKAAIEAGKPGSIKAAKDEITRLNDRISAMANRREMAAQAAARMARHGAKCTVIERRLLDQITAESAKMDDLRSLLKGVKRTERAEDAGLPPEQILMPARSDPILLLEEAERKVKGSGLTHDQARAAKEIAWVCEAITRAGQAKVGQMDANGGAGGGYREPDLPVSVAQARANRYLPWCDYLHEHEPVTLDICIKVSTMGVSLRALARKHKMRWQNVRKRLQSGLDRYWNERVLLPIYAEKQRKMKAARTPASTTP